MTKREIVVETAVRDEVRESRASTLAIGPIRPAVPVVLAPMAGITNMAYRRLCREQGAGVFVSEMITSRALVERTPGSMLLIQSHPTESVRSIQLYGVDPVTVREAVKMLVAENYADHIDLNFGCPVPKVTRKGGGAALPWKRTLFRNIVEEAVKAAGDIPLTVKMRKGIDADHLTFIEAGKSAEGAGASAIALHGRTASEFYSGHADWNAIGELKAAISSVPVLGNGDIWSAEDAVRMVEQTDCDGVVVGRGCLGRPWLFADLEAAFRERAGEVTNHSHVQPTLGEVAITLRRHLVLLTEFLGDEGHASRDIRKHMAWYFKGYPVGELRAQFAQVTSLAHLDDLIVQLDLDAPYPGQDAEGQRGRQGTPKKPTLPHRWLDSQELSAAEQCVVSEAEIDASGG
jgi:nifR3 family TIM-barrel protein